MLVEAGLIIGSWNLLATLLEAREAPEQTSPMMASLGVVVVGGVGGGC